MQLVLSSAQGLGIRRYQLDISEMSSFLRYAVSIVLSSIIALALYSMFEDGCKHERSWVWLLSVNSEQNMIKHQLMNGSRPCTHQTLIIIILQSVAFAIKQYQLHKLTSQYLVQKLEMQIWILVFDGHLKVSKIFFLVLCQFWWISKTIDGIIKQHLMGLKRIIPFYFMNHSFKRMWSWIKV